MREELQEHGSFHPNSAGLTPTVSQYLGKDCRGQWFS
jgi:hypothetical protein